MKITKLSLAAIAAMTITTGAMAEVTHELSGNVKLWYETANSDAATADGLFSQSGASGQAAISVEAKGKAGALGYGLKYTAVDTLGLENNLVAGVRVQGTGSATNTAHWAEKAFITYKMGNTMAKVGRQHLNTPLAFTEKWNVAANSFDAAVLMNSDIDKVTLVGAYVGRANSSYYGGGTGTLRKSGNFDAFGSNGYYVEGTGAGPLVGKGAYAAAALVKPMKDLGVNAWYYNVRDIADAVWVDADYSINGIKVGALYTKLMPKGQVATFADTDAYAFKAGTKLGGVNLFAAYSSVSSDPTKTSLSAANVATGFKKTKLPTAGVYADGLYVAQAGSNSFKFKAAMPVGGVKLAAQYINVANDKVASREVSEINLIAATKISDVNVKAIYINRNHKLSTANDWNHVRVIAGINF